MKIAIGIPAFNEEQNIEKIVLQLQSITNTIIVCNDGSTDLTSSLAKKSGAFVINHSKNLGYGASIKSIFVKAKEIGCDVLITFDADGQHRIEDIPTVLQPLKDKKADIVIGSRFLDENKEVPGYRKIGIKAITKLTNAYTGKELTDSQSGFRAYTKEVIEKCIPSDSGMGVSTEILIKAYRSNFKIVEVPIVISYEGDTSTHNPVSHGVGVMLSTLKFISIDHPLKFYGIPGIGFLTIGLFFILWTIQVFAESREIITNIALIGVSSTILGIILLMTSIMLFSIVTVVRERK
jgi:glycosyltransferase involved in cell wall biosynthesis